MDDPVAVAVAGDTVSDLVAGAAAHAGAVIGVLSGAHDRVTLEAAPHTALILDITGLDRRTGDLLTWGSRQKLKRVL